MFHKHYHDRTVAQTDNVKGNVTLNRAISNLIILHSFLPSYYILQIRRHFTLHYDTCTHYALSLKTRCVLHITDFTTLFTGLAHCKHLRTVREHLSGLVYSGEVINPVPAENEKSLTREFWESLSDKDMV